MNLLLLIIVAISLSMDAFSLSLAYGTINLDRKQNFYLSVIVGIYHFVMPLIGLYIGNIILSLVPISPNIIVFIILLFIGVEMLIESSKKDEKVKKLNILEMFTFGFAVSIDSFSVGIGLQAFEINPIICTILFSLISFLFTYFGLNLGKRINEIIGKLSTILGGIILIIIGLIYLTS